MKTIHFTLILSLLGILPVAGAEETDSRQLVELPPMMRQHMLRNMRDHLLAVTEIQQALAAGSFDQAAEIAEQRLGMSSLVAHGASHMAPLMPEGMRQIGTQMHRAASRFAILAQEAALDNDYKKAIGGLGQVSQACVACHMAFRTR